MVKDSSNEIVCPICGVAYKNYPALSRKDSYTLICPDCGVREALSSIGIDAKEQEAILQTIQQNTNRYNQE